MQQFGLIGRSLNHSFSQNYFNDFFLRKDIDAAYYNFELKSCGDFIRLITQNKEIVGLNVTVPYKQEIIPYLSDLDTVAENVSAVNVIKIHRDREGNYQKLKGFNTDVIGFERSINPLLKPNHTHALILGTGGAAQAVKYSLNHNNIKTIFVSRCIFNEQDNIICYENLTKEIVHQYPIIVNCTPCGTFPNINTCPPFRYEWITKEHLCFDLVYNPMESLFLKKSAQMGARIKNGYEMLIIQAKESWKIWNTN